MRILVLHNHYRLPGGEDSVVRDEIRLLRERHNEVYYYEKTNREIDDFPLYRKIGAALHIKYSKQSYMDVKTIIHKFRPDVAHFHNIFFMITPSAYFACKEAKVPVVQTMHNFRLFSPTGLLFPNSVDPKDYKECQYGFFRKKVIERMLRYHWRLNTWNNYVDQYIVLSEFARQQYMEAGIIPEKLIIKPNFVFSEEKNISRGDYILYIGRLSKEKGPQVLLEAWKGLGDIPLKIIGDGPLYQQLKEKNIGNVQFLGQLSSLQVEAYLKEAKCIVIPSICYENFPRTIAEAFSCGVPVIASRLGSMAKILDDGKTGLLFSVGDAKDLANKVRMIFNNETLIEQMRVACRRKFCQNYTADKNYQVLKDIYQKLTDCKIGV